MSATAPAVVPPNIMVLVSPVKGQEDRVAELIEQVSQAVKTHEPWIRYYRWYAVREVESDPDEHDRERGHGGVTEFYVVFRLDDPTKLISRRDLHHHQEIARVIREENLLRSPLKYLKLEDRGFWTREGN
ncbi:hypothetical protein ABEF95_014728 [Exophiala dermatitidis]